ncbi:MAG: reverse transcriptase domain-containing protein [Bryobacteraceae bacterium]
MAENAAGTSMKRVGNLWEEVTSFANLLGAAEAAAAGKKKRPDVAWFLMETEGELLRLRRELRSGSYEPGPYRTFAIVDPKPRFISAAPFRDRVVHHALTRVLEPIFEKRFSPRSFACRKGMGTHAALDVARAGATRFAYVLKCDVRKYFATIDHAILLEQLEGAVKCRPTLGLAAKIVGASGPQEEYVRYFDGDDLFTPYERRRGLPLGNQTSQFFANVYLNGLDQMVDRELRPGLYARYVDDFALFADSKERLGEMRVALTEKLGRLRLEMHEGKSRVYRCADGVSFLGWQLFPGRVRLAKANVTRFWRRLRWMGEAHGRGELKFEQVTQRVRAWIGHAGYGDTLVLRERLLGRTAFRLGTP